jgi:hypothetical protein
VKAALVALVVAGVAPLARADGCPPNSHEGRRESTGGAIKVHCVCDSGYAMLDGSCQPLAKARNVLRNRYREALKGMKSSLEAFANEATVATLTHLRDQIHKELLPHLAALLLAPEAKLAATMAVFTTRMAVFLNENGGAFLECRFDEEGLRTSCKNANRFREIANQSYKDLMATFDSGSP